MSKYTILYLLVGEIILDNKKLISEMSSFEEKD